MEGFAYDGMLCWKRRTKNDVTWFVPEVMVAHEP